MIIDSHQHVMLPTSMQLDKMREAGVDQAILFTTTPHVEKAKDATLESIHKEMQVLYQLLDGQVTPRERSEKMKKTIEELKEVIATAPDKFHGFGCAPLGLTENETADWVQRYVVENHFVGIGEFTPGTKLQMEQMEAIFKAASNYSSLPLWVHTFNPVTLDSIRILMQFCKDFPKVPVIFGHMGGSSWMDVVAFAKTQSNVYLDLSAMFTSLAVKTALTEVPERCLFSSDAPFGEPKLSRQMIEYVSPSEEITRMALGENIAKLLQLNK